MNDKQTVEEAALESIGRMPPKSYLGGKYIDQFIKGAKWQSSQQGWISIRDQLPIFCTNVLVSDIESDIVCIGFLSDTWVTGVSGCDVTHWMPLPNPPTPHK